MNIPFSQDQFMDVFVNYNTAVYPSQILLYFLAGLCLYLAIRKNKYSNLIISGFLALFWLWMGIVYHLTYFSSINNAAYIFGTLFIVQTVLFVKYGLYKQNLSFSFKLDTYTAIGGLFIIYSLIIYPLIGKLIGYNYPEIPIFGVPCPTTIFTFGILLWTDKKVEKSILLIPLIWSIIGFSAVFEFGILQDIFLLFAGMLGFVLIWIRDQEPIHQKFERVC